jgi:hypothetical protein
MASSQAIRLCLPWRLRAFARLPIGEKDERFGFLSFLRKQRLIGPGEAIEFWDGERLREVTVTDTEIYRQPKQSDLPLDLEVLLSEAVTLFTEGSRFGRQTRHGGLRVRGGRTE